MTGFYCHFSKPVNPNCPLSASSLASAWPEQAGKGEHSEWGRRVKSAPAGSELESAMLRAQDSAQAQLIQAARTELQRVSIHFYKVVSYPSGLSAEHVTGLLMEQPWVLLRIKLLGPGPLLVAVFLSEESYALDEICSRQYLHKCTDSMLNEVKDSKVLKD